MKPPFYHNFLFLTVILLITGGCGGGSDNDDNTAPPLQTCGFSGEVSGELNYIIDFDDSDGCGGAATANSELITSFGGITSAPNMKIYHENFQAGLVGSSTAHIIIHDTPGDTREWQTALGACDIDISSNEIDSANNKVKISGIGSCSSAALADTNTGAGGSITIEPFTFESIWLSWP